MFVLFTPRLICFVASDELTYGKVTVNPEDNDVSFAVPYRHIGRSRLEMPCALVVDMAFANYPVIKHLR